MVVFASISKFHYARRPLPPPTVWDFASAVIVIVRLPVRPSRLKAMSMPTVLRNVWHRRKRSAKARGFLGQPAVLCAQRRQVFFERLPNSPRRHVFVVVAIEVAGCSHFSPRNVRVARFQLVRQTSRCLGNDLKTADDGIEPHEIVAQDFRRFGHPQSARPH